MSLTYGIIGLTVLVSVMAESNAGLKQKMLFNAHAIKHNKQFYRFFTSALVHGGWLHLLFNMFTLFFFASSVENEYQRLYGETGKLYFLALYVLGAVIADIPAYSKHKDNFYYNSLGASGAVSAVVLASVIMDPIRKICLYGFICFPGFIWAGIYLFYSYRQKDRATDNINHEAHLYGALFGILFSIILNPLSLMSFFRQIANWLPF